MRRDNLGAGPLSRQSGDAIVPDAATPASRNPTHGASSPQRLRTIATQLAGVVLVVAVFLSAARAAQLTLTWVDNSTSELGFKIERAVNGTTFAQIATVGSNVTKYLDQSVTAGSTYSYRVRAYNSSSNSPYSNITTVSIPLLATATTTIPSRLVHISAKALAAPWGTGAFAVNFGISTSSKSVLLRAIGPGLAPYTTATTLADPYLRLFDGTTLINSNDNWGGSTTLSSTFTRVGAFPLPTYSLDSAILSTLAAKNTYSFAITGKSGGMGLAEIYDADTATSPAGHISRVFVRAPVGTASSVLVVGFAIQGTTSLHLLVRAIGPSLTSLSGLLLNPQLSIYYGSTLLKYNDNWGGTSTLISLFTKVGASPLLSLSQDSAIDITLAPGAYSAVISGVNSTTGLAQAEFYVVP